MDGSAIGNLQRTLTGLQLRAQPVFNVVSYKAEGVFSCGFVQHSAHGRRWMREEGKARLMDDVDNADADTEAGGDAGARANGPKHKDVIRTTATRPTGLLMTIPRGGESS